jgi:hypothetical protein
MGLQWNLGKKQRWNSQDIYLILTVIFQKVFNAVEWGWSGYVTIYNLKIFKKCLYIYNNADKEGSENIVCHFFIGINWIQWGYFMGYTTCITIYLGVQLVDFSVTFATEKCWSNFACIFWGDLFGNISDKNSTLAHGALNGKLSNIPSLKP